MRSSVNIVLVTGARGFLGKYVVRRGRDLGFEVHSVSSSGQPLDSTEWKADICNSSQLLDVLGSVRPDAIIHLAARGVEYSSVSPEEILQSNILGTLQLFECMERSGLRIPVVVAGSGFEYMPQLRPVSEADPVVPWSVYGVSKNAAVNVARLYASRFPVAVLRIFSVYGSGERPSRLLPYIIACARNGVVVDLTPGLQIRDYIFAADVAEAFWRTLAITSEPGFQILNVGSGTAVSLRDFAFAVGSQLRRSGIAVELRFGARPYRSDELMHYVANNTRMVEKLGWTPPTTLEDGVGRTLEEMLTC